ncbi:class I SAM-dependent DNA methyltransferase [Fusibacter bizertensis]
MEIYSEFASVYDLMQYDIDYPLWINQLDQILKKYKSNAKTVLELACGTGTISIGLSQKGYLCEALDLSEDMLTIAQSKAYEQGAKIKFYNQNMDSFNTKKKYDMICCMCDGMNYQKDMETLSKVMKQIAMHINKEGIIVFDLSTKYKLKEIIGNNTFAETFENEAYIWENEYDEDHNILNFSLTLFKNAGEGYERFEEYHTQKAYDLEEVLSVIEPFFDVIEIVDGDNFLPVEAHAQRICFILKSK